MSSRTYYLLLVGILVLSFWPRYEVAIRNQESNDDHMEVILLLMKNPDVTPGAEACSQCYHPKLFHRTCATMLQWLRIEERSQALAACQRLNLAFAMGFLLLLWLWLRRVVTRSSTQLLVFALVALNPKLMGISAQTTNDTLEFMLAAAACWFLFTFAQHKRWKQALPLALMLGLAGIAKGTGLLLWMIGSGFMVLLLWQQASRQLAVKGMFITVAALSIILTEGPYLRYYREYGTPFKANMYLSRDPFPDVWEKTYFQRPGITSLTDGFCTFRLFNLVEYPYNINNEPEYPAHRTSFWSQVYARALSVHFDRHPGSWIDQRPALINLNRFGLLIGLVPLFFFVTGFLLALKRLPRLLRIQHADETVATRRKLYFGSVVLLGGYVLFVMKYTCMYRDFSTMKDLYIYPALLPMVFLFTVAYEALRERMNKTTVWLVNSLLVLAIAVAYTDFVVLWQHMT